MPVRAEQPEAVAENTHELSSTELYKQTKRATFQVLADGKSGTGFFITSSLLVTNLHVIADDYNNPADASQLHIVTLNDDNATQYPVAAVVAVDAAHDLALLRIETSYLPSPVVPLKLQRELPEVGERVNALGNPLGIKGNWTSGTVSSIQTRSASDPSEKIILVDCPVSSGNSGGPVVNSRGAVIGVATAVIDPSRAQNINFVMPARYVFDLAGQQ